MIVYRCDSSLTYVRVGLTLGSMCIEFPARAVGVFLCRVALGRAVEAVCVVACVILRFFYGGALAFVLVA